MKKPRKYYQPQYRRTEKAEWRNATPLAPKGFATRKRAEKVIDFYKDAWKRSGKKVTDRFRVKAVYPDKKKSYKKR